MNHACYPKVIEILALARNFRELAEATTLPNYRSKLFETATHLADAARALDEELPLEPIRA